MEQPQPQKKSNLTIVGINMLIFAIYTIISLSVDGRDSTSGALATIVIAGIHAFLCVIMSIIQRRLIWILSALLLLIIGFATCVGNV